MARKDSKVKQHILTTTVGMISELGSEKIRIVDVAREASVGIPTIYYHFDSRAKLLAEAQFIRYEESVRPVRDLMDQIEAALAEGDGEAFWSVIDRYVSLVWSSSQVDSKFEASTTLLDDSVDVEVRGEFLDVMKRQYQRWINVVVAAQARDWFDARFDGEALTSLFWSASVGQAMTANSAYRQLTSEAMVSLFRMIVQPREWARNNDRAVMN